jgi:allophanate hydrolase
MTIESLRAAYATGLEPQEVITEVFDRIEACPDPAVWITRRAREKVLREARALPRDARERSPLWGIPFAVKDNIDCAGLPTSCGFPASASVPPRDAAAVARLRAAGALVIGKTNLDQFATGLSGVRSPYGAPRCVFDPTRISGGSSSGSAVAVARGLVPFALGTDTAGSGRVPAAFNNLVGVKPTRGIVSTSGVVPASRSLDCVSVFAASVAEANLVRRLAQGDDADDPYARRAHVRALRAEPVVGVLADGDRTFFGDDAAAALYAHAVQRATDTGLRTRTFDFAPFREAARLLYGSAIVAERLAGLEEVLRAHGDALEPALRTILDGARRHSGADVFRAQHALAALGRRASAVWEDVDLLLLPTAPTLYTVDELLADPIGRNANLGTYTNFVNLLDCSAIAVPAGFTESGLPFGVTVVAPAFSDDDLAVVADRLHRLLEPSFGMFRETLPSTTVTRAPLTDGVDLVVVGAHLSGEPLNHELVVRGATLVETTRTAPGYRFFALTGTSPAKPGLMRAPGFAGPGIEVEVWRLSSAEFGNFVASVAPPLTIGSIELANGIHAKGFLAEPYALDGAVEITRYGGWRAYRRSTNAADARGA